MPPPAPTGPTRTSRRTIVGPALVVVALLVAGCTGDSGTSDPSSGTTMLGPPDEATVDDPLAVTAYEDPAIPITAAAGERFALLLGAEPTAGYRWEIVTQGDPAVVLPLGSQFVTRDSLGPTTTTTSPPPPAPDPAATPVEEPPSSESTVPASEGLAPATEAPPPPTPAPVPTTTPTRSVQVLSYVARAPGRTTITLRYVRIGGAADSPLPEVTFTIEVVPAPPLF